jgi:hypothetical protein
MFEASHHDRHDFNSAREMADANRRFLSELATPEADVFHQILEGAQRIVPEFNQALKGPSNRLLNSKFESRAYILLGNNSRSVSTFTFADGSRAISVDINILQELSVLIFGLSRAEEYGSWLAAWLLYHNIQSSNSAFPSIEALFLRCLSRAPSIFNDIIRSCLFYLTFHEIGHEYSAQFGVDYANLTTDAEYGEAISELCPNPPHGPVYSLLVGSDGRDRIFVPGKAWLEEFAADQFAMRATMIAVSDGVELKFSDFEKTIHHLMLWQFVIKYLYLGNLFRHDQDRESHPSDHNRIDMLLLQLEPLGVPIFGDWKSHALVILQEQYTKLFSPEFAQIHRLMAERVQQPQPIVWSTRDEPIAGMLDKPDPIAALKAALASKWLDRPLDDLLAPLKELGSKVRYGHQRVLADMANFLHAMECRFETDG